MTEDKVQEKKKEKVKKSPAREWADAIVFAVVAATLIRWLFLEAYTIPTPSMEKSLLVGDFLFVSKIHYGPRTPTTPLQIPLTHQKIWGTEIKSYLDWIQLPSVRLPGLSEVKRNDVVVFNYPVEFEHPVDLKTNYIKRCVAVPGDVLEIKEKQVVINGNSSENPPEMEFRYVLRSSTPLKERTFKKYDITDIQQSGFSSNLYSVCAKPSTAEALSKQNFIDTLFISESPAGEINPRVYPQDPNFTWNEDNFGPLKVPAEGMSIDINEENLAKYRTVIENYEGLDDVKIEGDVLKIDGEIVTEYTFKQNYYFMMGDNRHNSLDSRFWGFVPENHIVGKALFIWMSLDPNESFFSKVRWNRLFNLIK